MCVVLEKISSLKSLPSFFHPTCWITCRAASNWCHHVGVQKGENKTPGVIMRAVVVSWCAKSAHNFVIFWCTTTTLDRSHLSLYKLLYVLIYLKLTWFLWNLSLCVRDTVRPGQHAFLSFLRWPRIVKYHVTIVHRSWVMTLSQDWNNIRKSFLL